MVQQPCVPDDVRDRAVATAAVSAGTARLEIAVRGTVQGVGFRPFVYRLARELALNGWVGNDPQGVRIAIEGDPARLDQFLQRLPAERPPHAEIYDLHSERRPARGLACFEIRASSHGTARSVPVLPDLATCPACLDDVRDPQDRRYRYPFTNCTHCGPRFSIVGSLPYDRARTTMRAFEMCAACAAEYADPTDRRFHAQPTACPACGPRLTLLVRDAEGHWTAAASGDAALVQAAGALRAGAIAAVMGLGGFHLMADAADAAAIDRLRQRKQRPHKPFALMAADLAAARRICVVSEAERRLLLSPEAPIVLLRRLPSAPTGDTAAVAAAVAPGNPTLGVMLPAMPLHHLLLQEAGRPVVATSGNLSDEPICTETKEAVRRLGEIADCFLVHDRGIARHVDDSIVRVVSGTARVLRRARGFAPLPVRLHHPVAPVLAVGAHLKNTIALGVGDRAFISQHIGDMQTPEAIAAFERVIEDFLQLYEARPVAIAHDLHPDYATTRWAQQAIVTATATATATTTTTESSTAGSRTGALQFAPGCALVAVQHHHAHLAACLAENRVQGPALGVIWDGTGYGTDGTVWGGEFLVGDASGCRRAGHLRAFPLPGGDAAIREPRRVALALLHAIHGEAAFGWGDLPPVAACPAVELGVLAQMLRRRLNTPMTTSMGRLFDAVAALAGLTQRCSFEGQAAIALEHALDDAEGGSYPLQLADAAGTIVVDWQPMLAAVVADVRRNAGSGVIAARFHNALVEAIVGVARAVGEPRVALSGGCFQNRALVERAAGRLATAGFEVILHRQVPSNDGGISLGQLAVAAARINSGDA